MNERIRELAEFAAGKHGHTIKFSPEITETLASFAQLLVDDVLAEVAERAYYSGDRAWSDELDRPWIELEYGFGDLAK